ncbi:hypothetical protein ACEPPN_009300 [Leptodophora sp. 'Broadleaf-Isolate-01']
MSSEIHLSVTIITKPGKEAEMKALIFDAAKKTEENEPGMLKYHFFEQYNAENGQNAIIIQEIYQNQAAYDFHHNTEYYNASSKVLAELVAEPTDVKKITPFAGFASR